MRVPIRNPALFLEIRLPCVAVQLPEESKRTVGPVRGGRPETVSGPQTPDACSISRCISALECDECESAESLWSRVEILTNLLLDDEGAADALDVNKWNQLRHEMTHHLVACGG